MKSESSTYRIKICSHQLFWLVFLSTFWLVSQHGIAQIYFTDSLKIQRADQRSTLGIQSIKHKTFRSYEDFMQNRNYETILIKNYDTRGNEISEYKFTDSDSMYRSKSTTYDHAHRELVFTEYYPQGSIDYLMESILQDSILIAQRRIVNWTTADSIYEFYNRSGNPTLELTYFEGRVVDSVVSINNALGDPVRIETYEDGKLVQYEDIQYQSRSEYISYEHDLGDNYVDRVFYRFDKNDKLLDRIYYTEDGHITTWYSRTVDAKGNEISFGIYDGPNKSDEFIHSFNETSYRDDKKVQQKLFEKRKEHSATLDYFYNRQGYQYLTLFRDVKKDSMPLIWISWYDIEYRDKTPSENERLSKRMHKKAKRTIQKFLRREE